MRDERKIKIYSTRISLLKPGREQQEFGNNCYASRAWTGEVMMLPLKQDALVSGRESPPEK